MALITETGAGLANAESYCTVAFADAYHLGRGREASWVDLDTEVKEQRLRAATDYLVQAYRSRWAGYRMTSTQALDWPRGDVPMKDAPSGYAWPAYYPDDAVPLAVQQACAQLAFTSISGDLAADVGQVVKSKKVGPIEVEYAEGSSPAVRYRSIDMLLSPLLKGGGMGSIQVVRA